MDDAEEIQWVICEVIKECGYHDDHEVGDIILVNGKHLDEMIEKEYVRIMKSDELITPAEKIRLKRKEIFSTTTKEERINQMEVFVNALGEYGKKNFPNGSSHEEEENE